MKTFLLLSVALALVAFSYAQDTSNAAPRFDANLLTVQGNGNAIVPANRTTFTVTLYGFGPNATSAQQALLLQISNIQTALSNFSLLNLQAGGIMYYPYYGAELGAATPTSNTAAGRNLTGFVASTTLSFSLNATDAALALDALMLNGTSYISISSRPDPLAIEEAQRLAVQMAVDDAVRKAQTALSRLGLCTLNITLINIESPISLLPAVNIVSNNFGVSLGGNFGLNMPFGGGATESVDFSQQPQNSAAGTGRSLISAHVWLSLYHTSCSTPGAIQDLTATIPQNNAAPGSQLGSILIGSSLPLATPSTSASASSAFLGSPSEVSGSPLGSSEIFSGSPSELSGSEASPLSASELSSSESGSGSAIGQVRRRRSFW